VRRAFGTGLSVLVTVAYPVAVYVGLSRFDGQRAALGTTVALLLVGGVQLVARDRGRPVALLAVPLTLVPLPLLAYLWSEPRLLLALPVLINLVFLLHFAGSLRGPQPIVERFARLQVSDLSAAELIYCRQVTRLWCGFFVVNGGLAGLLALFAPLSVWALYTGLLAYVLMGLLGAGEYLVRKHRFRRFSAGPVDRWLSRVLHDGATG
jgi:uncharacterized membrane protein